MTKIKIGCDVGNYDTKTQHTSVPSGYSDQKVLPNMTDEYLFYHGNYYVPRFERFNYSMDKTSNGHALILTMFGIAKEILFQLKEDGINVGKNMQCQIDEIRKISLGVGLPPGHYENLAVRTKEYYENKLKREIEFIYYNKKYEEPYRFRLSADQIGVFPQDFMAVYKNPKSKYATEYDSYFIIGIGGGTTDIIPVVNNKVDTPRCKSLELGTTQLYGRISDKIYKYNSVKMSTEAVESLLLGKKNVWSENADVMEIVQNASVEYVNEILDSCKAGGIELREAPVIFFGGGCLLLRSCLVKSKLLNVYEFIEDTHANAKVYARLLPN